jgi:uncharacterized Zn finger protein
MAIIDDWFDEATLLQIVPADVFMRGASAVEAGAVRVIERTDARLVTSVEAGTEVVQAEWVLAGEQLEFGCGCGQAVAQPCEHLIASALWTWPEERPEEK